MIPQKAYLAQNHKIKDNCNGLFIGMESFKAFINKTVTHWYINQYPMLIIRDEHVKFHGKVWFGPKLVRSEPIFFLIALKLMYKSA